MDARSLTWVLVIIGGIVAALAAVVVFDWMLIVVGCAVQFAWMSLD